MKYTAIPILAFLFAQISLSAQPVNWLLPITSTEAAGMWDILADESGNIYVTGFFFGEVNVGGSILDYVGGQDFFLAKYDPDGNELWINQYGEIDHDRGTTLELDESGDVFLGGSFSGTLDLGGTTLISEGDRDILIARFSPDGNVVWAKGFGGVDYDTAYDLLLSDNGLYATGHFNEEATFDGTIVPSNGYSDAWLLNLDPETGDVNWVTNVGGFAFDRFFSIAEDSQGEIAAFGYFSETISIGSETFESQNGFDPLLVKFNSAGDVLWAKAFGTPIFGGLGRDVVIDDTDNLYLSGSFGGSLTFGGITLDGYAEDIYDSFLISLLPNGEWRWGKSLSTEENAFAGNLEIIGNKLYQAGSVSDGTSYDGSELSGFSGPAASLFEFDLDGNFLGQQTFDGPGEDRALPIEIYENDVLIGISFEGSIEVAGETVLGGEEIDGVVVRFGLESTGINENPVPDFSQLAAVHWEETSSSIQVELYSPAVEWVSIFTIDGRLLAQEKAAPYMDISLPNMGSGMLFVQLTTADQIVGKAIPVLK